MPALLGWPGGPLGMGTLSRDQRVPSFARRKFWLPVSGQLSRRLPLFLPLFGLFVTLKIFMAAVQVVHCTTPGNVHAGFALHNCRKCHSYKPWRGWCSWGCAGWWLCKLLAWTVPGSAEFFYPGVSHILVFLISRLWICS